MLIINLLEELLLEELVNNFYFYGAKFMNHKPDDNISSCKVISFENYKDKKVKNVSSTIAAIIAINIDHPSDTTPEDFFISEVEANENIQILAFEDALENNNKAMTSVDAQNGALNDA